MVPPEAVVALGRELTEAGATGKSMPMSCQPRLHQPQRPPVGIAGVAYNEAAERRSWPAS
jgi:hypothetical protein